MPFPLAFLALLPGGQESVDAIRRSAMSNLGVTAAEPMALKGIAFKYGAWQPYELISDGNGRFRQSVKGVLPETQGFDGKTLWTDSFAGVPHVTEGEDRDLARIETAVVTGTWALPDAPLTFQRLADEPDATVLEIRCKGGDIPATLRLEKATGRPVRLSTWGPSGSDEWAFSGYRRFGGRTFATRMEHKGGGENERVSIQSVRTGKGRASFGMPSIDDAAATYDRAASPEIEVKRVRGYLFVRPKLDGVEDGWFFLDTGAEVMVLDTETAEKHQAPILGGESTAGVVGTTELKITQGIPFQLGPLTLHHPTYFLMDLKFIGKALGLPVAGICGYDAISRAGWDIDPKRDTIRMFEPGKATLSKGGRWTDFRFHGNIPTIRCGFEGGRTGLFHIDTGSGSGVDFCSPTVAKYDLLKGRDVKTAMTGGAGGTAENKAGTTDGFVFAGHRYDKLPAGFQLTQKGVFASPFFDGNLGMLLLGQQRLVLDYRNSRLSVGGE